MLNSANRTSRMIDDLLDLTRTRFGDPTPVVREPMDLHPLCRQVVAELEELRSAGALEYTSTGGIHGEWDHDPVAQLFSNLVRNAIQQGAETDAIKITATGHTEEVVLSVHNTGTAIPHRVMTAISEPMIRITDEPHNAGLGLYISQVALAHDGTLDAKSTEAAGATFTAHLPRR